MGVAVKEEEVRGAVRVAEVNRAAATAMSRSVRGSVIGRFSAGAGNAVLGLVPQIGLARQFAQGLERGGRLQQPVGGHGQHV